MSENKSPDGTYPTMPLVLALDGESVTNDKLCTSGTTGLGWIGKLVDAVGYLKARSPQIFNISTDGAGNVTVNRRTPIDDGATAFFSSVVLSGSNCNMTFGTAFASDRDYAAIAHNQQTTPTDRFAQVVGTTTTVLGVSVFDVSAAGYVDLTTTATEFVVVVYPNLAGYV